MRETKRVVAFMLAMSMAFQVVGFNEGIIHASSKTINKYIAPENKITQPGAISFLQSYPEENSPMLKNLSMLESLPTDFTYTIGTNNTVTVTGYRGEGGDVVIPGRLDGYPVTTITAGAFSNQHYITSVTFPPSLTSIANGTGTNGAFYNCSNLSKIVFNNSIAVIGNYAFGNCPKLTEVSFGDNILSIGNNAFQNCGSLSTLKLPGTVTSIGNNAFQNCVSLTSLKLPGTVTSIGNSAFQGCTSLISIELPAVSATIGNDSFSGCTRLETVKLRNH